MTLQTHSSSLAYSTVVSHTPFETSSASFASPFAGIRTLTSELFSHYDVGAVTENSDPF